MLEYDGRGAGNRGLRRRLVAACGLRGKPGASRRRHSRRHPEPSRPELPFPRSADRQRGRADARAARLPNRHPLLHPRRPPVRRARSLQPRLRHAFLPYRPDRNRAAPLDAGRRCVRQRRLHPRGGEPNRPLRVHQSRGDDRASCRVRRLCVDRAGGSAGGKYRTRRRRRHRRWGGRAARGPNRPQCCGGRGGGRDPRRPDRCLAVGNPATIAKRDIDGFGDRGVG